MFEPGGGNVTPGDSVEGDFGCSTVGGASVVCGRQMSFLLLRVFPIGCLPSYERQPTPELANRSPSSLAWEIPSLKRSHLGSSLVRSRDEMGGTESAAENQSGPEEDKSDRSRIWG